MEQREITISMLTLWWAWQNIGVARDDLSCARSRFFFPYLEITRNSYDHVHLRWLCIYWVSQFQCQHCGEHNKTLELHMMICPVHDPDFSFFKWRSCAPFMITHISDDCAFIGCFNKATQMIERRAEVCVKLGKCREGAWWSALLVMISPAHNFKSWRPTQPSIGSHEVPVLYSTVFSDLVMLSVVPFHQQYSTGPVLYHTREQKETE